MRRTWLTSCVFLGAAAPLWAADDPPKGPTSVYEFEMASIDGQPVKLSKYQDHVLVIVNVASQ